MPIYLKDVVAGLQKLPEVRQELCVECSVPLQETITGKRKTPRGDACSDCYYAELGAEIERHPIASGGVRRG